MRSKLFVGTVTHVRADPVKNAFTYPHCVYAIDIDELEQLDKIIPWFGYNRTSIASIWDHDYLSHGNASIRDKVVEELQKAGIAEHPDKIILITTPKILGLGFNPVSFYYCKNTKGNYFAYIAEITNTFSERAIYVFNGAAKAFNTAKKFHVSPFNSLDGVYDVRFENIEEKLDITFNLKRPGEKVFHARMLGSSVPMSKHRITLFRFAGTILLTLPRIYLQAMKLYLLKRLPVFKKPNPPKPPTLMRAEAYTWLDQVCIWLIRKTVSKARWGLLEITYPDGSKELYGDMSSSQKSFISLNNFEIFWKLVKDGGIGFGESYTDGDWDTPSLYDVLSFVMNNYHTVSESSYNWLKPKRLLNLLDLILKNNSQKQAKKNISEHYDLGNEMFSLFLDPTLSYSAAQFLEGSDDLEEAQKNKIRSILAKARINSGDSLLEIGSGWGELALTAAKEFDCNVTGVTISEEQAKLSREKIRDKGLSDKITIELKDYREIQGSFQRVISVEMIEAVGKEYLGKFLATIEKVLAPDGVAVLQIIAYHDNDYRNYLKRQDWIQKHIFPGSHLPSLTAFCEAMASNSNLVIESIENIPHQYAKTLRIWRENFNKHREKLLSLGYDDRFQRAWNFYLTSCEAEFATRWLAVYQIVLTRPNNLSLAREQESRLTNSVDKAA